MAANLGGSRSSRPGKRRNAASILVRDAVILDLTIPGGMSGKETMAELLRLDPQVTAIVSSGYSFDPVMADYRAYGFQGVLAKPYTARNMAALLSEVVRGESGRE